MTRALLVVAVAFWLSACGPPEVPDPAQINAACDAHFPNDQYAANDCKIRLGFKALDEVRSQQDRAVQRDAGFR